MTKTNDEKKAILDHLNSGKTLTIEYAKKHLGIGDPAARLYGMRKNDGVKMDINKVNGVSTYSLAKVKPTPILPKLIYVFEEIDYDVKLLKVKFARAGNPLNEKEIYLKAIEIGLKELAKQTK